MIFCTSCNSDVSIDEVPVLQAHGKCTRCYVRSLSRLSRLPLVCDPMPIHQAFSTRAVTVGVPLAAEQRVLVDTLDGSDALSQLLTVAEELARGEEAEPVDGAGFHN